MIELANLLGSHYYIHANRRHYSISFNIVEYDDYTWHYYHRYPLDLLD